MNASSIVIEAQPYFSSSFPLRVQCFLKASQWKGSHRSPANPSWETSRGCVRRWPSGTSKALLNCPPYACWGLCISMYVGVLRWEWLICLNYFFKELHALRQVVKSEIDFFSLDFAEKCCCCCFFPLFPEIAEIQLHCSVLSQRIQRLNSSLFSIWLYIKI